MLILLIGAKGSGKSHIGRILESAFGIHFFHVEPQWMAYYAACQGAGRQPTIAEGIATVHPAIAQALHTYEHLCVETTGAAAEILAHLLALSQDKGALLVKVQAPLEICLHRIATRDQTQQIPMAIAAIKEVYQRNAALTLPFDLVIENSELNEEQIVGLFSTALGKKARLL